jgi:hypothetical protein
MAFLKNDGDIILDAVLTDAGRRRLAAGDGTFNITKFALGDDEINYALHDASAATAYQDLEIDKTPVLEAFTNSKASLKHRLITLDNINHLYLPVIKLNTNARRDGKPFPGGINAGIYPVLCTKNAFDDLKPLPEGFIDGRSITEASQNDQLISLDHGLDTLAAGSWAEDLSGELTETVFEIFLDHRFGRIVTPDGSDTGTESVENDIARYIITTDSSAYFSDIRGYKTEEDASVIAGARAPQRFKFGVRASDDLAHSTYLFTKFGRTSTGFFTSAGGSGTYTDALVIDTTIRVVGQKTGLSIDIPVRFVREP